MSFTTRFKHAALNSTTRRTDGYSVNVYMTFEGNDWKVEPVLKFHHHQPKSSRDPVIRGMYC